MSSRDGAVMRMTGPLGEESAESASVLGCDVGELSATEGENYSGISVLENTH